MKQTTKVQLMKQITKVKTIYKSETVIKEIEKKSISIIVALQQNQTNKILSRQVF